MRHFFVIALVLAFALTAFASNAAAAETEEQRLRSELVERKAELRASWQQLHEARTELHDFMRDDARTADGGAEKIDELQAQLDDAKSEVKELRQGKALIIVALRALGTDTHDQDLQYAAK
jgi:predicted RNase H-like nuclease (RuvC/YqgF family)